jgi:hypothetical protein
MRAGRIVAVNQFSIAQAAEEFSRVVGIRPHRWCLQLIVVVEFECSRDPESYAGGSVGTGRVTHAGQVKE